MTTRVVTGRVHVEIGSATAVPHRGMWGAPNAASDSMESASVDRMEWRRLAACTVCVPHGYQSGHDLFHVDSGLPRVQKARARQAARRVCGICPVVACCAQFALDHDERDGVWAGIDCNPISANRSPEAIRELLRLKTLADNQETES